MLEKWRQLYRKGREQKKLLDFKLTFKKDLEKKSENSRCFLSKQANVVNRINFHMAPYFIKYINIII